MTWYPVVKRALDLAVALASLVATAPLLAVIAVAVKCSSPGPVLYRGVRVGRFGRRFRLLKFRTMRADAELMGGSSTPEDDPRVTRVGSILRAYKLDELPQLWNVVTGEMSLVGPRPQVEWDVETYTSEERRLLSVRPGITDYASLRFRDEARILRGASDPDAAYIRLIRPEKIRLGLEYVNTQSLRVDLAILGRTAIAMVFRRPAVEDSRPS